MEVNIPSPRYPFAVLGVLGRIYWSNDPSSDIVVAAMPLNLASSDGSSAQLILGMRAVGVFLFFGAAMAAFAGSTLLWPGPIGDRVWTLNPAAHAQLVPMGRKIGVAFLLLSLTMLTAGIGWFRQNVWGWRLAIVVIGVQLVGDFVNALRGEVLKGAVGVLIAGGLLVYLLSPAVRTAFR
jgi:hypothetical protein